mgnify:CR=1 FL=1
MKRHVELRIDAIRFTHKERKRRVQCFDFVEVVQNESSNSCRGFSSVAAPFFSFAKSLRRRFAAGIFDVIAKHQFFFLQEFCGLRRCDSLDPSRPLRLADFALATIFGKSLVPALGDEHAACCIEGGGLEYFEFEYLPEVNWKSAESELEWSSSGSSSVLKCSIRRSG